MKSVGIVVAYFLLPTSIYIKIQLSPRFKRMVQILICNSLFHQLVVETPIRMHDF
ncbi:uncharacterized protein EURHEDRAFT_200206 [Aspergillus ruber CBS 135680]|uniref:Uncharacterized protein n=1 Tax=Aspergillus ruber (strain CBS 135680) TaxID=1388766 RepID=A0A017S7T6_ASPRC|nr:uncharacterized protein EURHEDRAFT_200206 [Aspergillus ruber CBS 135680]EYE92245.1 hypothetical protein EURHEDRAFT_200206 [Aspergillus ruber CBS 135680]